MEHRYRRHYSVRYDECDTFNRLTPAAALRYLQDIAGLDAVQSGISEGGVWIARRTQLEFRATLAPRTEIEIETYLVGYSKVTAQRGYSLMVVDNPESAIVGRTTWVFIAPNGRPARLPTAFTQFWPEARPPQPDQTWPATPARPPVEYMATVRFSDLDMLAHMNNAAYVELMDNAAWQAFGTFGILPDQAKSAPTPLKYDIEYLASAKAGDTMMVKSWFESLDDERFELLQYIVVGDTMMVKAQSEWRWHNRPVALGPLFSPKGAN